MTREHILVIKHGALGDIILASGGFAAIRAAHPAAHITLLTTKPYANLLAQSPYFDEIWVDSKPRVSEKHFVTRIGQLRRMLNSYRWAWIYDLQTSGRTTLYQWLFKKPWPRISNISRWTSHGYHPADRMQQHAFTRLRNQLTFAGISAIGMPDISWMMADITDLLPHTGHPYALLIPGGAPHRPDKRWPDAQYASLATELVTRGFTPVLLGTAAEEAALQSIAARVPQAVNLCGKTGIPQIASLARNAAVAVGNDTGPMHIIATAGCPSVVLFSHASDPARSAPVGPRVQCLREQNLGELSVDRVLTAASQV